MRTLFALLFMLTFAAGSVEAARGSVTAIKATGKAAVAVADAAYTGSKAVGKAAAKGAAKAAKPWRLAAWLVKHV